MLVLSSSADAASASGLSVLTNLAPAAVPAAALSSGFSKSSSHKLSYLPLEFAESIFLSP
jgi:hypothetical protein